MKSVITYGPGEEAMAEAVAASSREGAAQPVASTLKQYVALARRASLFVGGDTGPLHLAAASRTPVVGLYGPTSPERNGPFDRSDINRSRPLVPFGLPPPYCGMGMYGHSVSDVIDAISKD